MAYYLRHLGRKKSYEVLEPSYQSYMVAWSQEHLETSVWLTHRMPHPALTQIIAWLQDTNDQIRDTHRNLNYIAVILIGSFIVWCVQQIALYVRLQFSFQVRK